MKQFQTWHCFSVLRLFLYHFTRKLCFVLAQKFVYTILRCLHFMFVVFVFIVSSTLSSRHEEILTEKNFSDMTCCGPQVSQSV